MTEGLSGFLSNDWMNQAAPQLGPQAKENVYRWATVTVSSPLQIQLDGDSLPLPLVPESLIEAGPPAVGARVWVQLFGRRVIVLGVAGGLHDPTFTASIAALTSRVAFLENRPRVHVSDNTGNTFLNSTAKVVNWDTEVYDNFGMHNGTNPSRITIPVGGLYAVDVQVQMPGGTYNANSYMSTRLNSGGVIGGGFNLHLKNFDIAANASQVVHDFYIWPFAVNDYIETFIEQNSGVTRVNELFQLSTRIYVYYLYPS